MTRRMPSLLALLGLVAVAGYQNRERIADFIRGLNAPDAAGTATDSVKKVLGEGPVATTIAGGLGQLVDQFQSSGLGEKAESWIGTGPNAPISETQMEQALGTDLVDGLMKQSGLDRTELLSRLAKILPEAVDKMTPEGRIPG